MAPSCSACDGVTVTWTELRPRSGNRIWPPLPATRAGLVITPRSGPEVSATAPRDAAQRPEMAPGCSAVVDPRVRWPSCGFAPAGAREEVQVNLLDLFATTGACPPKDAGLEVSNAAVPCEESWARANPRDGTEAVAGREPCEEQAWPIPPSNDAGVMVFAPAHDQNASVLALFRRGARC